MDIINYLMVDWDLVEKKAVNQFIFKRKATGKQIFIIIKDVLSTRDRLLLVQYYVKGIQPFIARIKNSKFEFEDFMFGGILKWI
jgi:hypothetical protein